ncbi:MAG: hypothetical protein AB2809_18355 [Candidatus Thiodiazotropha sp.]
MNTRRTFLMSTTAMAIVLLSGCAPTTSILRPFQSPQSEAARVRAIEQRVNTILAGTTGAANRALVGQTAAARFASMVSHAQPAAVSVDFSIQQITDSPVLTFAPGAYNPITVMQGEGRVAAAFLGWVRGTLDALQQEFGSGLRVSATYYGGADGLPVSALMYQGEFGMVDIQARYRGTNRRFRIAPGSRIGNPELAVLRAYGLRTYLHHNSQVPIVDRGYEIETSQQVDSAHRYVRVTIHLSR